MNLIPLTDIHLPPLARWLNDLPGTRGWDTDWVRRKALADQNYDPSLALVAEAQGEPVGFVIGVVHGGRGWIKALIVRPDWQRRGVGRQLLRTVEASLAQQGVNEITLGWAPLSFFAPGVDVQLTAANVFLERHGYGTDRVSRINMEVRLEGRDFDTADAERKLANDGIVVERVRPEDQESAGQLAKAEGYAMWSDESAQASQNDPISMFVARQGGQVCGFAVHSVTGPGEFGPMLTASSQRGRGVGAVLLKRCLTDLQRQGYRCAEIIWVGPISFYARAVEARVSRVFWEWKKSLIVV